MKDKQESFYLKSFAESYEESPFHFICFDGGFRMG